MSTTEGPTGFVVRGALVLDGTGGPALDADVEVVGDRIGRVGPDLGDPGPGVEVVDGAGLVLSPGFIDTHTHDDFAVVLHPDMGFKVQGGVTTCIVGNCGLGAAPHRYAAFSARAFHPHAELPEWEGYAGYLDHLDQHPPSVNVGVLVGHGTVRAGAMGLDERPATPDELDGMAGLVAEGMAAGCLGMSSGLIYPPGRAALTDELVHLARVVAEAGGVYTSHIRDEAITIGVQAGLPVVISHLKASGEPNWGKVSEALARIDAAGPTVAVDQYPYTAGSTVLSVIVDGVGMGTTPPASVVIASTDHHPEWHGRSLLDLAPVLGVEPDEAGRVVLGHEPSATVVIHTMAEDDVRTVLAHPGIMIGSDGIPSLDGVPHPRLYGTFARVLGHYSRDEGVLSLEDAVHRMTGRSAAVFGLHDRGRIAPNMAADLVLFDAEAIVDRGTYDDPHHTPAGIVGVWVNGTRVVDGGDHLGTRPGRVLRRGSGVGPY